MPTRPPGAGPRRLALARDGALTIEAAVGFSGLGRSKLFDLLADGELPYVRGRPEPAHPSGGPSRARTREAAGERVGNAAVGV